MSRGLEGADLGPGGSSRSQAGEAPTPRPQHPQHCPCHSARWVPTASWSHLVPSTLAAGASIVPRPSNLKTPSPASCLPS